MPGKLPQNILEKGDIMLIYFFKRLLQMIPLLFAVSLIVFLFIRLIPGDPARMIAGVDATYEDVEAIREMLGFNYPIITQYFNWLGSFLTGDFGISIRTGRPVSEMMEPRFTPTLILAFMSMIWSLIIGLTVGMFSAIFRGKWPDYMGMLLAVSGISIPSFWLGLMLINYIAIGSPIFSVAGVQNPADFVLPSITLGAGIMAMLARISRSEMVDVMRNDYIRMARAKGLNEFEVITKHGLRNSMVQIITVVGLQFGFLLGGSVIVERVFGIAGLGGLLVDSIFFRDYTVVQSQLMIFATLFIMVNLAVDIAYGFLNPKIRL
jgi:glutathione transport system permease protein